MNYYNSLKIKGEFIVKKILMILMISMVMTGLLAAEEEWINGPYRWINKEGTCLFDAVEGERVRLEEITLGDKQRSILAVEKEGFYSFAIYLEDFIYYKGNGTIYYDIISIKRGDLLVREYIRQWTSFEDLQKEIKSRFKKLS